MSISTPRRERTGEPALWPLVTGALIVIAAIGLLAGYGALRLGQVLTHQPRSPWAVLGPTLLVLVHAAALLGDPLSRSGPTTLLLAALYTPCLGYGLYQAIAVYGPALAHTAARLL
jgi:hypothetical protein